MAYLRSGMLENRVGIPYPAPPVVSTQVTAPSKAQEAGVQCPCFAN